MLIMLPESLFWLKDFIMLSLCFLLICLFTKAFLFKDCEKELNEKS